MKRHRVNWLFFLNNRGFAGDGGDGDDGRAETVSKEEFDKMMAENEKLRTDLEDVRMEILTPQYMEFLDSKEKGTGDGGKKDEEETPPSDDEFKNLTPKQIYDKAVADATKAFRGELDKQREESGRAEKERVAREIKAFAKSHEDFETFRPIMHGLSVLPENADLSLNQLYDKAKEHVKRIHTEPSENEKKKSREASGMKPGGDNDSLEKYQKMGYGEIAKEAASEVADALGPIPSE